MKHTLAAAAIAALSSVTLCTVASAVPIYDSVGFEPVAGWTTGPTTGQTAGAPPYEWFEDGTSLTTGVVQTTVVNEGVQAVQIDRNGNSNPGGLSAYGPSSADIGLNITDPTNTQRFIDLRFSMTVTDSGDTVAPFFGGTLSVDVNTGSGSVIRPVSFGVDASDPDANGTGEVVFFTDVDNITALTSGGDVVEVDLSDQDFFDYVIRIDTAVNTASFLLGDGSGGFFSSGPISLGGTVTALNTGTLSTGQAVGGTDGANATGTAYYDEFSINVDQAPEPASMALLAIGGLGLIRRRKA